MALLVNVCLGGKMQPCVGTEGGRVTFAASGAVRVEEILAFIDGAIAQGAREVAVPAACLPLLAGQAGCLPEADGTYRFPVSAATGCCGGCERAVALLFLVVLSPVFLLVAAAVLVADGWPVFFRQQRYGCRGRRFSVYKFRTMVQRSESLHGWLQRRRGQAGRLFKLENDPRVTRFGTLLRRTFLDELPQLLNVVRGEMRFVGPRPLPESDQGHYTRAYHALRLNGVPGITGLWQVSGRNERTFDEMCLLDFYYLCNRSWAFDLRILARTFPVVCKEAGLKRKAERCGG